MKKFIIEYCKIIIIATLITCGWQGLKLLINGRVTPDIIDSFIATILTFSLYFNLKKYRYIKLKNSSNNLIK